MCLEPAAEEAEEAGLKEDTVITGNNKNVYYDLDRCLHICTGQNSFCYSFPFHLQTEFPCQDAEDGKAAALHTLYPATTSLLVIYLAT